MKYTVKQIDVKNNTNIIHAGNYIITVPPELKTLKGKKINIDVYEKEHEPPKSELQLYGQVFRTNKTGCIMSAGGYLCHIPHNHNLDTFLYVTVTT